MTSDRLRYDLMVEKALRSVVREALTEAAERGLPGDHHFYVTFATRHPGVEMPAYLRSQYPQEMTVVIQYQFYALSVDRDRFSVTLSFNNAKERLSVPFAAVTTFADPAVNFALQFQTTPLHSEETEAGEPAESTESTEAIESAQQDDAAPEGSDKVVTLDRFRKKQDGPSG